MLYGILAVRSETAELPVVLQRESFQQRPCQQQSAAAVALPHDWLFPKMRAVVHHGGAGTTGAGLRAGVPSIVVPFTMDQPFWASRVHALGVGPKPIPRPKLTRASRSRRWWPGARISYDCSKSAMRVFV